MTIQSGDIKFLASKVMDDVHEGGGGPTGTIIPDGASNAMFEDVTEVDRAGGAAHIRQAHLAVQTPDTERFMGANIIVSRLPNDDNVSVTLAACSTFARRTEIANAIENYLIKGPEWGGYLLENHVAGQRSIQLLQRPGAPTPPIGRTLALVYLEGLAGEVLQYVRITRVTTVDRTFSYQASGSYVDYQATIVTCDLSDALRYAFPGSPPDRLYARAAGKTIVRDTTVADAATYYGAVPLAAPAVLGDMSAKVLGIYSQLVPSSRTETAAIDQKPAAQRALVLATAPRRIEVGVTPHSLRIRVGQENRGFAWVQILKPLPAPGTIVVSFRALGNWYTLQDNGAGEFTGSGTGTVDYATGSLSITLPSMPDADSSIIINWGESTAYTSRSGSVGFRMPEFAWQLPHAPLKPGSVSIGWMSGGVLRTVTDNGSGQLSGTGGAGEIAYATGHIFLRPTYMIDAGGEFATTYTYTNTITQSFEGVTPDAGGFATLALAETPAPRSITARWITTRTVSASSGSTEVVTQGKTEAGVTARQSIISQTPGTGYKLAANGVVGPYDFPPGAALEMKLSVPAAQANTAHTWEVFEVRNAAGYQIDLAEGVSSATSGSVTPDQAADAATWFGKFAITMAAASQYRTVTVRIKNAADTIVASQTIAIEPRSVVKSTFMPPPADVVRDPAGVCIAVPGMRNGGTHHASGDVVRVACAPLYDATLGYCYDPPASGGAGQVWSAAELLARVKTMTSERGISTNYSLWT